jgi:hypothetical protein
MNREKRKIENKSFEIIGAATKEPSLVDVLNSGFNIESRSFSNSGRGPHGRGLFQLIWNP